MKISLTILLFLSLLSSLSAQVSSKPSQPISVRICTPSKAQMLTAQSPLYVLFSYGKMIMKTDTIRGFKKFSAAYIKSINVLKDSATVKKYGSAAKNGVIEIYLDDEKYTNSYKLFLTDLHQSN